MRLEINTDKVDAAMAEYLGPETTGKGLVQWLLERFTAGEISTIASMNRPSTADVRTATAALL